MVAEAVRPGRLATGALTRLPLALTALTVAGQIAYPLTHGPTRDRLTIAIVMLGGLAAVTHAATTRGPRTAAWLVLSTSVLGFVVEVLGVHTGLPFGRYAYASSLGWRALGVPLVIGLAWTMLAWPAALVAQRLVTGRFARIVVGAWALASWDLFLDPQMVSAHHWSWASSRVHLPGVPQVPVTNYLGWLLVASLVSLCLQAVLRTAPDGDDRVPFGFYLWTFASSVLALGLLLGLGAAACWGALAMSAVAVPLAVTLWRGR